MRAKYCLILVSWVALICYICVGKMYSKVSLRMEFTVLLGGLLLSIWVGYLAYRSANVHVFRILRCGFWTRYNRFLLLGCPSCVWVLHGFQKCFLIFDL